jgi:hypothetical protein
MSGDASLVQVQAQWDEIVITMEKLRRWGDDELLELLKNFEQSAIGSYTPQGFASWAAATRATFAGLASGGRAASAYQPMMYEYGKVVESPYQDLNFLFRDIYDYNHDTPITVPSRELTFGAPSAVAGTVGNGIVHRLTKDWNDYDTEACRVETKTAIVRSDQNSGTRKHAELWEIYGQQPSLDSLGLFPRGTGPLGTILSRHAGSGQGGSLLRNSSFDNFGAGTFSGWEPVGAVVEDPNFYRTTPGQDPGLARSAAMAPGSLLAQAVETQIRSVAVNTPYFLRVMLNASQYGASGPFSLRIGSQTFTVPDVGALPPGWNEVTFPATSVNWLRNWNVNDAEVVLDFTGGGGANLLVDDAIFTPWDEIDGTFLVITGGNVPFMLDDSYLIDDTQADATKGLRNYWTYRAGFGYLPHDNGGGSANWADPVIP